MTIALPFTHPLMFQTIVRWPGTSQCLARDRSELPNFWLSVRRNQGRGVVRSTVEVPVFLQLWNIDRWREKKKVEIIDVRTEVYRTRTQYCRAASRTRLSMCDDHYEMKCVTEVTKMYDSYVGVFSYEILLLKRT